MPTSYDGLRNAVVLITGGAHGLGRYLGQAFGSQGSRVALVDRDERGLTAAAAELALPTSRLVTIVADLCDTGQLPSVIEQVRARYSRLDVLVNNAAIVDGTDLDNLTPEVFDQVISTNLRAPLFLSRAALNVMIPQGGGRIVNVASAAARTGGAYPTVVSYAASKAGLLSITRSLARVAAAHNVLVNAIVPSNIDSPMLWGSFDHDAIDQVIRSVPLERAAQPGEVAELVLWLSSNASAYVTGAAWDINGGWLMT